MAYQTAVQSIELEEKRWVENTTSRGRKYRVWEWCRLPRIRDEILDCSIYLYRSIEDAKKAESAGGSGFLVRVISDKGQKHVYAVTNSHVAEKSPVIRLNTKDGQSDVLETAATHWRHADSGDDIAVLRIEIDESFRYRTFPVDFFMNHDRIQNKGIGPGDEAFTVGRFINHEGKQRNRPSVRFGAISMMADPNDGVWNDAISSYQESYLVETHTRSGYSGSPVFVYIPPFSMRPDQDEARDDTAHRGPWLLGVDWGHIVMHEPVFDGKQQTPYQAQITTGMMGVVPAWKLWDLLHEKDLVAERDEIDQEFPRAPEFAAVPESVEKEEKGGGFFARILSAPRFTYNDEQKKPGK